jgi:hypothetical protein
VYLKNYKLKLEKMKKKVYEIKIENFIEWFYSDESDLIALGESIINLIKEEGSFMITPQYMLGMCETSCIPLKIIDRFNEDEGREIGDLESHEYEIKLID